ncbi:hypothetical protein OH809_45030 (plasmid) [Streptomyces sp. NBC_00873]|uniref:hypothetical protein n=1 Tax=Streptomyces sp. NBC_00873 TaxID=2975852 RepID=UPI0037DC77A9|nr:hypothetical protein OH809_45030 [Streptomyces sp. NBC_00873]
MRRPTQHHNIPASTVWAHPYTGVTGLGVFYNDGGAGDASDPAGAGSEPPKPAPPAQRTFTQAEVEALAAKEKAQGKRSAAKELAEKLGFTSIEDTEAFVAAARQAKEAQLTEQEKRERDLADREAKAEAREKAAEARERAANRRAVLVGLGATGDDLDDASALLRVPDDADEATLQEAADKLKSRRPELFGATPQPAAAALPPAPAGAPAGGPPRPAATKDDINARARKRAEQMGFRSTDAA